MASKTLFCPKQEIQRQSTILQHQRQTSIEIIASGCFCQFIDKSKTSFATFVAFRRMNLQHLRTAKRLTVIATADNQSVVYRNVQRLIQQNFCKIIAIFHRLFGVEQAHFARDMRSKMVKMGNGALF